MNHDHVHKYYRTDIGREKKYIIYRCALPTCTHYLPAKMILGKLSVCFRCGNTFQIVKRLMLKKPHCVECTKKKKETKVDEFLEEVGL